MKQFLIELGGVLVFLFLCTLFVQHKEHVAYDQGRASMAQERDKQDTVNNNAALEEQEKRTEKALLETHYYKDMADGMEKKMQQENAQHEKALGKARADALAGRSGMQCPGNQTASQATGQPARPNSSPAAAPAQGRTDLMPEAASAILSIAADSARLVREHNELIDMYNAAQAACNSSR